jgi:hypothetical protein
VKARISQFVWAALAIPAFALPAYWALSMHRIFHDKAVNANALQRLWSYGRSVPLRTVVPAHNRWTDNAFVAEPAVQAPGKDTSVLILDDHYRGGDPTYRTESGLIGDDLSIGLLCSLPSQAAAKGVRLDPVVVRLVRSRCNHQ